jgi:hypothetical protein
MVVFFLPILRLTNVDAPLHQLNLRRETALLQTTRLLRLASVPNQKRSEFSFEAPVKLHSKLQISG